MNALLAALLLALSISVAWFITPEGPAAVLACMVTALIFGVAIYQIETDRKFLLRLFAAGLLVRMLIGTVIFVLKAQKFFGGDAIGYDYNGFNLLQYWQGSLPFDSVEGIGVGGGWGMVYTVAGVYWLIGRNMLAIQFINAAIGAATAAPIYLCAHHVFQNVRAARLSALLVAFYPSLVLWSSQGLKDGPIVFMLSIGMLATLKLGEKMSIKYLLVLIFALLGTISLRFYVFYMLVAAIVGAFVIGMRQVSTQSLVRQFMVIVGMGLAMTYFGVLRTATAQFETYGNLEAVQRSRLDQATTAKSGFGQDVDVSTTSGAISAIPIGLTYLLFAPFPWQLASLRSSITLPEMIIWWGAIPLLMLGLWFTLKYRLRPTLPILIFTTMLTLAYAVYQGNIGTAYRQRSQILVFYFIFVAAGFVLLKERSEDRKRLAAAAKQAVLARRAVKSV